jgi:hypothetical protein
MTTETTPAASLATIENLRSLVMLSAALKKAKPEEKIGLWEKYLTEIVERIAPNMTARKKLTTAIATDMVERIEALQDQIDAIYTDAQLNYDGTNNGNLIREVIKARAEHRNAEFIAAGLLESLDVEDTE